MRICVNAHSLMYVIVHTHTALISILSICKLNGHKLMPMAWFEWNAAT